MDRETLRQELVVKTQALMTRLHRFISAEDKALMEAEIKTFQNDIGLVLDAILANYKAP